MLATIAMDTYDWDSRKDVASALDDICSPLDNLGWASSGVYAYWEVNSRSILYLGLATNLSQRFCQHNGLVGCPASSCKLHKIKDHLAQHGHIGFSIAMQSPLDQPLLKVLALQLGLELCEREGFEVTRTDELAQQVEGALIEAFRQRTGAKPPWNAISGSTEGRVMATSSHFGVLDLLSGSRRSALIAKSTIRQIATVPGTEYNELLLHAARCQIVGLPWPLNGGKSPPGDDAQGLNSRLEFLVRLDHTGIQSMALAEMKASGYLEQECPLLTKGK